MSSKNLEWRTGVIQAINPLLQVVNHQTTNMKGVKNAILLSTRHKHLWVHPSIRSRSLCDQLVQMLDCWNSCYRILILWCFLEVGYQQSLPTMHWFMPLIKPFRSLLLEFSLGSPCREKIEGCLPIKERVACSNPNRISSTSKSCYLYLD